MSDCTLVEHPVSFQGVTLWFGDQCPVTFADTFSGDCRLSAIQRAVTVARLRTLADIIEKGADE